ncbi:MAG: aspartyl protease family protein [Hyphomonas sp.]
MFTRLVLSAVLLAIAGCAGSAPPPPVEAAPNVIQPGLRVEGNRLYIPVTINGVETEALLDSGAEMTLLDTGFAAVAGLVAFGEEEARGTGEGTERVQFAEGVTILAAGETLADRMVAIMDLGDISARLIGRPLTVILGREFFDAGRVYLDIEAGILAPADAAATPAGEMFDLSDAHGIKQMPVMINGLPVMADFDLGNGGDILLSAAFAEAAGLLAEDNILGTATGGGIGGPVDRTLVRIDSLAIGSTTLHGLTGAVGPSSDGADMNVGVSVLRGFRMVIDYPQDRVWLEPR